MSKLIPSTHTTTYTHYSRGNNFVSYMKTTPFLIEVATRQNGKSHIASCLNSRPKFQCNTACMLWAPNKQIARDLIDYKQTWKLNFVSLVWEKKDILEVVAMLHCPPPNELWAAARTILTRKSHSVSLKHDSVSEWKNWSMYIQEIILEGSNERPVLLASL